MSSMVGINNFFTRVLCPSLENQLFISQQAPLLMWTKRRAEGAMVAGTVAMALSSSGVWWVLSWISLPSGLSLQRAPTRYAHPSPFLLYETEHLNLSHLYSDQKRSNYKCRSFCKAKIIRHTCVQPCPLLDPPLVAAALRDPIKIGFWVCPRHPRRGWRTSRQTSSGIDDSFHRQSSCSNNDSFQCARHRNCEIELALSLCRGWEAAVNSGQGGEKKRQGRRREDVPLGCWSGGPDWSLHGLHEGVGLHPICSQS